MYYYLQYIASKNRMFFVRFNLNKLHADYDSNFLLNVYAISDPYNALLLEAINNLNYPKTLDFDEVNKRMSDGCICYIALINNEPVAYYWVAIDAFYLPYVDSTLYLKPNERYGANAVVAEKYRGRGLYNQFRGLIFSKLKNDGVDFVIGSYMSWNSPIQRANHKFGYEPLGYVTYGYLLTLRYFFNRVDKLTICHHGSIFKFYNLIMNKFMS